MINLCYTCGSCDAECPINRRSKQLSPRKIVRFHLLGYTDEASNLPEIWYCVKCGRCGRVCPMGVKPFEVIEESKDHFAKKEPQRSRQLSLLLQDLKVKLQQARHKLLQSVFREENISIIDIWNRANDYARSHEYERLTKPVNVKPSGSSLEWLFLKYFDLPTNLRRCFNCGSCTNACPVSTKNWIFSPLKIFRMVRWGLIKEAVMEPGIWLCIDCGRCMDVCPQKVKGLWILKLLREYAVAEGIVTNTAIRRWDFLDRELYRIYHNDISGFMKH